MQTFSWESKVNAQNAGSVPSSKEVTTFRVQFAPCMVVYTPIQNLLPWVVKVGEPQYHNMPLR